MEGQSPDQFDDAICWVLDTPDANDRILRARQVAAGNERFEAQLLRCIEALERNRFLEHPEESSLLDEESAEMQDRSGSWLGSWQIVGALDAGGMGEVYEAVRLLQDVEMRGALKILRDTHSDRKSVV